MPETINESRNDQWKIAREALKLATAIIENPRNWPPAGYISRIRAAYLEFYALDFNQLDENKRRLLKKDLNQFNKSLSKIQLQDHERLASSLVDVCILEIPDRPRT